MKSFTLLRPRLFLCAGLLMAGTAPCSVAQDSGGVVFSGVGWMQDDFIGHSSDYNGDFNGKSVLSTGAQLSLSERISDRLRIRAGIGMITGNTLQQSVNSNGGYSLPTTNPYVSEADFTYQLLNRENSGVWLRGGLFPYTYNPDVKDLGLYLLRGPVHPGIVISGYENEGMLPIANLAGHPTANIMGLQLHHQWGGFQEDFLLSSETEYYPFFDVSPVYVASYQVHPAFRIGAGVNFYHLISVNPKLERYHQAFYVDYSDTAGGKRPDTTSEISFAGTKLMATAALDPKLLVKSGLPFGSEDLKLYGEVGLIGLEDGKAYRYYFGDYLHRMPVMEGFNIPAFNLLDCLSLEVEWYGAPFEDDLSGYTLTNYSAIPLNSDGNRDSDKWKWSLHAEKAIQKHVMITLQAAKDHYRPGIYTGPGDNPPPKLEAILVAPRDWYLSAKLSYFF